jgi:acyl-coenzyme A thioesterase PaaI-like protein
MKLNRHIARVLMNLYPPMLANRIVIKSVSKDFLKVTVKVRKSIWNRNLQGSIFGGSIFSAADPFIALMYWQALHQRNIPCEAWLKSATIHYKKPSDTSLLLIFELNTEQIESVQKDIETYGRAERNHLVKMINKQGDVCVEVETLVVLKAKKNR